MYQERLPNNSSKDITDDVPRRDRDGDGNEMLIVRVIK